MSTRTPSSSSTRLMLTIGLCFLVALMEGLDLQAAGIAAGGIAQAVALDKMQMGWIFSAGILGLLPGALVGGMLADRYGRKRILISQLRCLVCSHWQRRLPGISPHWALRD